MRTQLPLPKKGAQPPHFRPISIVAKLLHQDATWYGDRTRRRPQYGRWRPSSPPQKGGRAPPQFSALVYYGQTAGWIKMALVTEVGLGPCHTVLNEDPAPLKGHSPLFSAHGYCDQTAGWMKTLLGMEADLSPGHIMLDGTQLPRERGISAPTLFLTHVIVYCGHGRPSQLLPRSCLVCSSFR